MDVVIRFEKTSNPVFSEGKDLQGNMPTMPRTDSMFDRKEEPKPAKKPSNDGLVHGQKNTGHPKESNVRITQPGTTVNDGRPDMYIYFDRPGDFQPR